MEDVGSKPHSGTRTRMQLVGCTSSKSGDLGVGISWHVTRWRQSKDSMGRSPWVSPKSAGSWWTTVLQGVSMDSECRKLSHSWTASVKDVKMTVLSRSTGWRKATCSIHWWSACIHTELCKIQHPRWSVYELSVPYQEVRGIPDLWFDQILEYLQRTHRLNISNIKIQNIKYFEIWKSQMFQS